MPLLPVLSAASQVGKCEDEALFQQIQVKRRKTGILGVSEAAIAVEQHRVGASALQALFVDQKHRDLRAVLLG
jgi:hypothetical protein